jgi:hypothetical protein
MTPPGATVLAARHDLRVTTRCQRHGPLLEAFFDEREQVILGVAHHRKRDHRFDESFAQAEGRVQDDGVPPMFTLRPALRELERIGAAPGLVGPMIQAADRANAAVAAYVERPSWPSPEEVGWSGAFAAAALVVHADDAPRVRQTAMERMRSAVDAGAADPRRFAHLADRCAAMCGHDQIYGTLVVPVDGELKTVWPIASEGAVDEARSEIGLPPLSVDRLRYEEGAQPGAFLIPSSPRDTAAINARLAVSYLRHGRWTRGLFGRH